jgi:hypothetical protein
MTPKVEKKDPLRPPGGPGQPAARRVNPRNTSAFSVLEFEYRVLEFEYRDTENRAKRVPFSRNSVDPQTETMALRVVWGA